MRTEMLGTGQNAVRLGPGSHQLDPVHLPTTHFLKIQFNIILICTSQSYLDDHHVNEVRLRL
jgi:hypothetical protein